MDNIINEEAVRNGFVKGNGLYVNNRQIADFAPHLVAITEVYDEKGNRSTKYDVKVTRLDGTETETKSFDDLSKIDWLVDFEVYDALFSGSDKKRMIYYLQQQVGDCKHYKKYRLGNGFYYRDNEPIMVICDKVYKVGSDIAIQSISNDILSARDLKDNIRKSFIVDYAEKMLNFMPGITEPLFYLSILGAIKGFLNYCGVVSSFIGALVGPSGHLKTTLARKYALWTNAPEDQEISFADSIRVDTFQRKMESKANLNFLIDDYHEVSRQHTKNRYKDRLDDCTRLVRDCKNVAFAIITAESLEDSSIFSALDRIFQIRIERMSDRELSKYKAGVSNLPNSAMGSIVDYFVEQLICNFDEAVEYIKNYINTFEIPEWCDASTRIPNQYQVLTLVEKLFCKYVCDSKEDVSKHEELQRILESSFSKQLAELNQLRRKEQEENVPLQLMKLVDGSTESRAVELCRVESCYNDKSKQAFIERDLLRITSQAIQNYMIDILGYPVSIKKVSKELDDAGILLTGADKRTVKFHDTRHYIINIPLLRDYCRIKYHYE